MRTLPAVAALLSSAIGIDSRVDQKLTTGTKGISTAWAGGGVGVAVGSGVSVGGRVGSVGPGVPDGEPVGDVCRPGGRTRLPWRLEWPWQSGVA